MFFFHAEMFFAEISQGDVGNEGTRTGVQWGARIHSQQPASGRILVGRCSCSTGAAALLANLAGF